MAEHRSRTGRSGEPDTAPDDESIIDERIQALGEKLRDYLPVEERESCLTELVELAEGMELDQTERFSMVQQTFMLGLRNEAGFSENQKFRQFLEHCIESVNLEEIHWHSSQEATTMAEVLYAFRFREEVAAERIMEDVRRITLSALHQFEQENRQEEMFDLLRYLPLLGDVNDPELVRLRNRARIYEMHRVARRRNLLYTFLLVQAVLVVVIFPMFFLHFENGQIQSEIENLTAVEIEEGGYQFFTYPQALYWSAITSASVGYGDITPVTWGARILAMVAGTMGVLTVGVVAGLVLDWITPRELF